MLGYARGLAELSQISIRGGKRAVDAIAAGMSQETPAYRALTEAAALGPDFVEGRAAFAEKRAAKFVFRGSNRAAGAGLAARLLHVLALLSSWRLSASPPALSMRSPEGAAF